MEGTNVVISNLIAGKKYIFMVAAKTSKGIGPYVDNGLEGGKFGAIHFLIENAKTDIILPF